VIPRSFKEIISVLMAAVMASGPAMALDVAIEQGQINLRGERSQEDVSQIVGFLTKGSVISIPDEFIVYIKSNRKNAPEKVNWAATFQKWESETKDFSAGIKKFAKNKKDFFYQVKIVKAAPGSNIPKAEVQPFMALKYLAMSGKLGIVTKDVSLHAPSKAASVEGTTTKCIKCELASESLHKQNESLRQVATAIKRISEPSGSADGTPQFVSPLDSVVITSNFGRRRKPGARKSFEFHPGVDLRAHVGTAVHPSAPGIVESVGKMGAYGNIIIIDHGNGWKTRYAHLSKISVKKGDTVNLDSMIGKTGRSGGGHLTGPHLHLEIRHNDVILNAENFILNSTAGKAVAEITGSKAE
jgi:murein DD-endopeptidase MepM/ murein hydrolase activator NlpD